MSRTDYFEDPTAPVANSLKVAVSALVRNKLGQILMIHRADSRKDSIPGGGMEVGETPARAAVREVKEETGIDITVTGLVGVFSNPQHVIAYDDGEVRQEFSICFTAEPVGGELRTSTESKAVGWIEPESLVNLNIHPSIRLRIERGLEGHPEPYYT